MKIIAVIENDISAGGGFNQALNALLQMKRLCENRFNFAVFTNQQDNLRYLERMGIPAISFSFSVLDRFLSRLALNSWWQAIQIRRKIIGSFEKQLISNQCDLVYFVNPTATSAMLQRLNYISTVWDLCHRDTPEFPEVRDFGQFLARERHYKNTLAPAFLTLTDSDQLSCALSRRYGVDSDRLLAMPFAPAPFLDGALSLERSVVAKKYQLPTGYFFYPAQFWAHKNHARILEALLILKRQGREIDMVFAGGDQGNRSYIERLVGQYGLSTQVRFLGFVPAEDMRGLYEGCAAVVMPTYFGPTNLPPLEAWMIGKPLIYSNHFKEQVGDAAICIDPDDAGELAKAMHICFNPEACAHLTALGKQRLQQIEQQRLEAETTLVRCLVQFGARRKCWL